MNWLIIITLIILGIVVALAIFIGYIFIVGYSVALGIGYKNETEASAWDYWESMKSKRWSELSDEEKEKNDYRKPHYCKRCGCSSNKGTTC